MQKEKQESSSLEIDKTNEKKIIDEAKESPSRGKDSSRQQEETKPPTEALRKIGIEAVENKSPKNTSSNVVKEYFNRRKALRKVDLDAVENKVYQGESKIPFISLKRVDSTFQQKRRHTVESKAIKERNTDEIQLDSVEVKSKEEEDTKSPSFKKMDTSKNNVDWGDNDIAERKREPLPTALSRDFSFKRLKKVGTQAFEAKDVEREGAKRPSINVKREDIKEGSLAPCMLPSELSPKRLSKVHIPTMNERDINKVESKLPKVNLRKVDIKSVENRERPPLAKLPQEFSPKRLSKVYTRGQPKQSMEPPVVPLKQVDFATHKAKGQSGLTEHASADIVKHDNTLDRSLLPCELSPKRLSRVHVPTMNERDINKVESKLPKVNLRKVDIKSVENRERPPLAKLPQEFSPKRLSKVYTRGQPKQSMEPPVVPLKQVDRASHNKSKEQSGLSDQVIDDSLEILNQLKRDIEDVENSIYRGEEKELSKLQSNRRPVVTRSSVPSSTFSKKAYIENNENKEHEIEDAFKRLGKIKKGIEDLEKSVFCGEERRGCFTPYDKC